MKWQERRLDQLGSVSRGRSRHRPRDAEHLYGGPYPFFQTGDVREAELYLTKYCQTYSEAGLNQSRLWPAGTLCITIAANIADTAILGIDACFPDSVIGFIADKNESDVRFIKYMFDTIKQRYQQVSKGAAQDNLSQEKLLSFSLLVPSPDVQKEIADILSAYDDLIENNRRRIALLEESARQLYQKWFVRLRFPGHERIRTVDGVPTGWERRAVRDVLSFHIGGGWGQDESVGNETDPAFVIRGTDIPEVKSGNFDSVGLRYHSSRKLESRLLKPGDIVFEVSGGSPTQLVGRTLLITDEMLAGVGGPAICASFCKLFRIDNVKVSYFMDGFLKHIRESGELSVYQKQSASALQNFQFDAFLQGQRVPLPRKELLTEFYETVRPIVKQQHVLAVQIHKLRAARDLLLPRLMSGEVAV